MIEISVFHIFGGWKRLSPHQPGAKHWWIVDLDLIGESIVCPVTEAVSKVPVEFEGVIGLTEAQWQSLRTRADEWNERARVLGVLEREATPERVSPPTLKTKDDREYWAWTVSGHNPEFPNYRK